MFYVEKMLHKDFEFAVKLTDTVDWGFVEEDFEFTKNLEPEGCFVLYDDSVQVGIATTIAYNNIGWFGNLIVRGNYRRKGAGSFLVRHSLKYLSERNLKTIGLYAYLDRIPFYEALGFVQDDYYQVLKAEKLVPFGLTKDVGITEASKENLGELVRSDSLCFGDCREKLLEALLSIPRNICYLSSCKGRLLGFVMAKVYEGFAEVGPLVCKRKQGNVELSLLHSVFSEIEGFNVSICVPKRESSIIGYVKKCGFTEDFPVVRMFFNPSINTDCITIPESLERG